MITMDQSQRRIQFHLSFPVQGLIRRLNTARNRHVEWAGYREHANCVEASCHETALLNDFDL